jgi:hypothetical protein
MVMEDQTFDFAAALDAMQKKAGELGVRGVAALLVLPKGEEMKDLTPQMRVCGRYARAFDLTRGSDDKGSNYLGIAFSKIAEMIRTQQPSGVVLRPRTGELGFEGGLFSIKGEYTAYASFSGGTSQEDVQVALAGLNALGFLEVYID